MTQIFKSSCLCGAVEVSVEGDPVTQGFCHCTSCRKWTGQPILAYALWPASMVTVTKGDESLARAARNENLTMRFCTRCGGNLMVHSAAADMIDVFPLLLGGFDFEPACHVNYAERVIEMRDGLPKFRDMPERAGGSGEMMPE